jgi:DNA-binding transcriptional LysR family regulator
MSRQVDEATTAARRAEAGEVGSLGVGVHLPVAASVLSVLLRHWSRLRPAVRPRLTSGRACELVDLVRRRELDVALVDGPVTDRGLRSVLVLDDHMVVVLPADHPLTRLETVSFGDLRGEPFVAVARPSSVSLHDRFIQLCGAAGFSPEVALEVDDPELLPMAVAAGLGVGLAAGASVAAGVMPGLVCRPLADARATVPLVAVSAGEGVTAQTREFLHMVENLHHGSRLLHPISSVDVDLADPPHDEPVGVGPALLRRAV